MFNALRKRKEHNVICHRNIFWRLWAEVSRGERSLSDNVSSTSVSFLMENASSTVGGGKLVAVASRLRLLPGDIPAAVWRLPADGFPENRDVCQLFLMKGCRPWPQTTASVKLLKTLYLLSQLKMLCVIYTCDNFVSKAFLYNKEVGS